MIKKILICGTRKKGYKEIVEDYLDFIKSIIDSDIKNYKDFYKENYEKFKEKLEKDAPVSLEYFEIVEGECPNSADVYAKEWAEKNNIKVYPYPSTSGNYLKRNIKMVEFCNEVVAFWDNFSYGTCHTIATAIRLNKPVKIINIK